MRDRWLFGRKTDAFTLQWHLTNACEAHCRHCYDRSDRGALSIDEARRVLADLVRFAARHRARPHACLTGGNPFLFPGFIALYEAIAAAGVPVSILGNPAPESFLSRLFAIARPAYYQLSLEGLEEHDDAIRGRGHFRRTLECLAALRALRVKACVMLTLTRANLDQVFPLAEQLAGRADRLTFNRLTCFGEGATLEPPTADEYEDFLVRYTKAARTNRILWFKDGLFNILRERHGRPLTRGCTGYGCGAAFNFLALLPDGEVHACRKIPSPLGNVRRESLDAIWSSPAARRWREGSRACRGCPLRKACGGCPAVTGGLGGDPLVDRDPHCFRDRTAGERSTSGSERAARSAP